jgi:hypothetical protein
MDLIFCNIAWMKEYKGTTLDDPPIGGGRYVKENGDASESCNFLPIGQELFGMYRPIAGTIDLKKHYGKESLENVDKVDEAISPITVVWISTNPDGGRFVVGWYKNATIYRKSQPIKKSKKMTSARHENYYFARANTEESTLLEIPNRTLRLPQKSDGGPGTANTWYAEQDTEEVRLFLKKLTLLINSRNSTPKKLSPSNGGKDA